MAIRKRIFLVGCPRSGTTLLQSFLASHSQVASFPESKFFQRLIYPGTVRTRLGLASKRARSNFDRFFEDIDRQEMKKLLPRHSVRIDRHTKAFITALDTITIGENKTCWLEKTPAHVQRLKYIEKLVPQSKFIHIIREGKDVVASLHDVTHKFPEIWNGAWDIDRCIKRWQNDVRISNSYHQKANHLLIEYDLLVESPQIVLEKICDFVDVPFEKGIIQNRASTAPKIVRSHEKWKSSVGNVLQQNSLQKFNQLFDEQQKKYIAERIEQIDYVVS